MVAERYPVPLKSAPHVGPVTASKVARWVPSLGMWGIAAGGALALFLSPIPIFQKDVLMKLPVTSTYFKDTTPDSDKPF